MCSMCKGLCFLSVPKLLLALERARLRFARYHFIVALIEVFEVQNHASIFSHRSLSPYYLQELSLSSHVISEFSNEGSAISRDGSFATSWLKNSQTPFGPLMVNPENVSVDDCNPFEFCAQQCSIPKSVLQQFGSSLLLRATTWEMYGR